MNVLLQVLTVTDNERIFPPIFNSGLFSNQYHMRGSAVILYISAEWDSVVGTRPQNVILLLHAIYQVMGDCLLNPCYAVLRVFILPPHGQPGCLRNWYLE